MPETVSIGGVRWSTCELCNRFFPLHELNNHRKTHLESKEPKEEARISFLPGVGGSSVGAFQYQGGSTSPTSAGSSSPTLLGYSQTARKRGRPRKNPDEPRKKRGAIEYDPMGDSCTRILIEYRQSLLRRAQQHQLRTLQHQMANSARLAEAESHPRQSLPTQSVPSSSLPTSRVSSPSQNQKPTIVAAHAAPPVKREQSSIQKYHNFDYNSNIA